MPGVPLLPMPCTPATPEDINYEACYPWCDRNPAVNCNRCKCKACDVCSQPTAQLPPLTCSLTRREHRLPKMRGLHGYNTIPVMPYADPAYIAGARALFADSLRYPGGTVANYFDWRSGSFVQPCAADMCDVQRRLERWPAGSFRAQAFARGAAGLDQVFVLNVVTADAAGMRSQLAWLSSQGVDVAAIEFGNELFSSKYSGVFPTAHAFMAKVTDAVGYARQLFPFAKLAAPFGFPFCEQPEDAFDTWNRDLARYAHVWDALTLHDYSACARSVGESADDRPGTLMAWGDVALRKHRAAVARTFDAVDVARLELWLTEVGFGAMGQDGPPLGEADPEDWHRTAFAGIHSASYLLAVAAGDSRTRRLHLHLLAAEEGGRGSKVAMVRVRPMDAGVAISEELSAAAQVVSHVAATAQRGVGGSVGIVPGGIECPQMPHAVAGLVGQQCLAGAAWLGSPQDDAFPAAVVLINRCLRPIRASLVSLGSASAWDGHLLANVTVYPGTDNGDRVRVERAWPIGSPVVGRSAPNVRFSLVAGTHQHRGCWLFSSVAQTSPPCSTHDPEP